MSKQPTHLDEVIEPELLGNLLEAVPPQAPPPGLRAKVLARALGPNVFADIKTDNNAPSMRDRLPENNPGTSARYTARDEREQDSLTMLNENTPFDCYIDPVMLLFDLNTEQTRDILNKAATQNRDYFAPCGIPGTQLFYFKGGPGTANATCGIVKMAAGTVFPAHEHQGEERVIILQGSATEQSGRSYHAGAAINCPKGTRHSFRAHENCTLVFAVLLEKPNKWLLGQIVLDFVFGRRRFVNKSSP